MLIHRVPFLVGLIVLALYVSVKHAYAESPAFHQNITVGKDGAPTLQLTNDSELSITAFVMVEFPSLGMEGRTYYDVYTNSGEQAIPSGASITKGLSHFQGAERRVRAEVRAVIFKDGSTAGDPVWVNAVLVRRLRMHDRLLSLHDLLRPLVGTGASRESMLEVLSSHLAETDKQPEDDLRLMDDAVFHGAISTFDRNREAPADAVLKAYLKVPRERHPYIGVLAA